LKYASTPQLSYAQQGGGDKYQNRFPAGSQPIATAPQMSSQPVIVYESNGQAHWALFHNNGWQALKPFKDFKTGSVSWRMDGTRINQPVAWAMPRKK